MHTWLYGFRFVGRRSILFQVDLVCSFLRFMNVLRARGIDQEAARKALVYSFGSEIHQKLISDELKARVDRAVLKTLSEL